MDFEPLDADMSDKDKIVELERRVAELLRLRREEEMKADWSPIHNFFDD